MFSRGSADKILSWRQWRRWRNFTLTEKEFRNISACLSRNTNPMSTICRLSVWRAVQKAEVGRLPWNLRRLKIAAVYPDFSSSLHVYSLYIVLWFTKVSPCLACKKTFWAVFGRFLFPSLPLSSPLPCPFHRDPVPASAPDMTAHPGGAHRGQRLVAGICVLWRTHKHTHTLIFGIWAAWFWQRIVWWADLSSWQISQQMHQ